MVVWSHHRNQCVLTEIWCNQVFRSCFDCFEAHIYRQYYSFFLSFSHSFGVCALFFLFFPCGNFMFYEQSVLRSFYIFNYTWAISLTNGQLFALFFRKRLNRSFSHSFLRLLFACFHSSKNKILNIYSQFHFPNLNPVNGSLFQQILTALRSGQLQQQ